GLLLLVSDLAQRRDDLPGDERHRDEDRREHQRREREQDLDPVVGKEAVEPAAPSVEQEERQADDNRREGEREVDERVHEPFAREPPADDEERADDTEDGVRGYSDRGGDQRDLQGVDAARRRDRFPGPAGAVLERPPQDHRQRPEQDDEQVADRQ